MKRPSKFDGESATPGSEAFSPSGPPLGSNLIQFPSPAANLAGDTEGAGVSSASASSTFVSLGAVTHAVLLRLQGGFPRVKVLAGAPREEERARRPLNRQPGGDELAD